LELSENIIINDDETHVLDTLTQLQQSGIQITLDDFGTGYTSLSLLRKLPVDRIKIDKSFIDHISTKAKDAVFVKAIINFATHLGIQVLAEGVECVKQLQTLLSYDCHEVQGEFLSLPLASKEVASFLIVHQNTPFQNGKFLYDVKS